MSVVEKNSGLEPANNRFSVIFGDNSENVRLGS